MRNSTLVFITIECSASLSGKHHTAVPLLSTPAHGTLIYETHSLLVGSHQHHADDSIDRMTILLRREAPSLRCQVANLALFFDIAKRILEQGTEDKKSRGTKWCICSHEEFGLV